MLVRSHRARKRAQLRCLTLEIRDAAIATLVRRGWLAPGGELDPKAIRDALYRLLDRYLGGVA